MSDDRLSHRHFLVVDDEAFIRKMVRRYLYQSGAAGVVEASNGQAAIEKLLRHDMIFDCVITDFEMKPTNGLELLKAIRTGAHGLKRNTAVLMLTSHARPHLVAAALSLDADGFVAKPIARETLVERIYRVIRRRVPIRDAHDYREAPVFDAAVPEDAPKPDAPGAAPPYEDAIIVSEAEPEEIDRRKPPQTVIPAFKKKAARPGQSNASSIASTAGSASAPDDLAAAAVSLPLAEVRPNSVLAQNIYGSDQKTLLVGVATVLTAALLNRLKDLQALHSSFDKLLVVEPGEDGAS